MKCTLSTPYTGHVLGW